MSLKIKTILNRINRRNLSLFPKLKINTFFKIIFILFILFSAVFVTKTILAQTADTTDEEIINSKPSAETIQEFQQKQKAMEHGNNQERWIKEAISSSAMSGINILAGTIPDTVLEGNTTGWVPGGLIGLGSRSIAALYNIPISGVEYLAYVKDNFMGKSTYAANDGFQGLSPLIDIWKGFRNMTYILFSVVFVVIGILIMLRVKISPQAVINIQNAIPKLITSLILVTFSYAIVGLLIDFSYVITGLGISVVSQASGFQYDAINTLEHPSIIGKMFGLVPFGAITIIAAIIAGIAAVFLPAVAPAAAGITFIIVFLIVAVMIVVLVIKFFINLAKCYLTILLKTIIAPLEIAVGAIPNMKMGFNTWFLSVFSNIMVFPVTLVFLIMAEVLMTTIRKKSGLWTPPGLKFLLSGGDIISIAIGVGALSLVSKLPKIIPELIFQIKPSGFGKAIGEGFATMPGVGLAKGVGGMIKTGVSDFAGKEITSAITNSPIGDKLQKWKTAAAERRSGVKKPTASSTGSETTTPAGSQGSGRATNG